MLLPCICQLKLCYKWITKKFSSAGPSYLIYYFIHLLDQENFKQFSNKSTFQAKIVQIWNIFQVRLFPIHNNFEFIRTDRQQAISIGCLERSPEKIRPPVGDAGEGQGVTPCIHGRWELGSIESSSQYSFLNRRNSWVYWGNEKCNDSRYLIVTSISMKSIALLYFENFHIDTISGEINKFKNVIGTFYLPNFLWHAETIYGFD